MKMIILAMVVACFCFSCTTFKKMDKDCNLSRYGILCDKVSYNIDGVESTGYLIFINYYDIENDGLRMCDIYLLNTDGRNRKLLSDSSSLLSVYDAKASKNSKYLAVLFVGEGHPWIEIYDLQKLIVDNQLLIITEINPYPGNVYIRDWRDEKLEVDSDINLLLKNDLKDLEESDFLEKPKRFYYNLGNKKFE